jgi:hypothetical protein
MIERQTDSLTTIHVPITQEFTEPLTDPNRLA